MTCSCLKRRDEIEALLLEEERKRLASLGNLPRGFYQVDGGFDCGDTDAAFVRGILLPTAQYDAMSLPERLALQEPDVYSPPRWRLYGGPFTTKSVADEWDRAMYFWAFNNGLTWISHNPVCILPPYVNPPGWPADSSVQWSWVQESQKPPAAQKSWNAATSQSTVVWV